MTGRAEESQTAGEPAAVLIVDDEVHAIEGLRRGVPWEVLGVRRLLSARNIRQAKKLLLQEPIDIVVCDIEMPQGSGLELVSWINDNRPGIDAVFLTCHAEFDYARRAVQLGSFDYLLKPVPYGDLERTLRRLIERRAQDRKNREYLGLGIRWERGKEKLAESFWAGVLSGRIRGDDRAIAARAVEYETSVDPASRFVPVLLAIPAWRDGFKPRDEDLYQYAVRKCAEEVLEAGGLPAPTVPLDKGSLVAVHLFPPGSAAGAPEGIWENYRSFCLRHFGCEVRCLIGPLCPLSGIAAAVDALSTFAANSFACREGIVRIPSHAPEPPLPDMAGWSMVLQGGGAAKVRSEVVAFLSNLSARGVCDARTVCRFHEGFSRVVHSALQAMDLADGGLGDDDASVALARKAAATLPDLIAWINDALARLERLRDSKERSRSAVETAKRYVEAHVTEEISCVEIAARVRLHPDYLSRVFKRETGQSVHEYVIAVKMALARELLAKTALPVSEIASRMGYANFSHFAGAFKCHFGSTPSAFRAAGAGRNAGREKSEDG